VAHPRLCFTKEDADREVEDIKSHTKKFKGSFIWLRSKIFYYKFDETIGANTAKVTDFPSVIDEETDKLLPQVQTKCVEIDVDVGIVPKKKIRLALNTVLAQQKQQFKASLAQQKQQFKASLQRIQTHGTGEIEGILEQLKGDQMPNTTPPAEVFMSSPNEDAISECVKDQLVEFVSLHDNLKLTVNKGRIEENTPIVVITRYAKSRPDTMILKSATIEATPTPEAEEGTSSSTQGSEGKVNGATTENKLHLKRDQVGQTIAGAEKMAGEIAYEYMKRTGEHLRFIEVVSLLVDFGEKTAEVFKLDSGGSDFTLVWVETPRLSCLCCEKFGLAGLTIASIS